MILFGAATNFEKRKGYSLLLDALKTFDKEKYCIGVFGNKPSIRDFDGFDVYTFGYVLDEFHMSLIYSSADVFAAPSLQENLSNAVLESLSCGVPVVAFNIGGMSDMIIDGFNGYLSKPFNIKEFATNILAASNIDIRDMINTDIGNRFGYEVIGKQYANLYYSLLKS